MALNDEQVRKFQEGLELLQSIISPSPPPPISLPGPSGLQRREPVAVATPNSLLGRGRCSRALHVVRNMRSSRDEQRNNFAPYNSNATPAHSRYKSWKGRFVCLSNCEDDQVPCTSAAKEVLIKAGLGEKLITVPNIDCSGKEFIDIIGASFPKLKDCGGFELLRCLPNSKSLDPVSAKMLQSPRMLKSIIGSGRIFIRPIQQNLSLDDDGVDTSPMIEESCLNCGMNIKLSDLKSHIKSCQQTVSIPDSDEEDIAAEDTSASSFKVPVSLESVLLALSCGINYDKVTNIEVRRGSVFANALRAARRPTFCVSGALKVEFIGEPAVDGGGPKREFFCILAKEMQQNIFEGPVTMMSIKHDPAGIEANMFYCVGMLMAMAVVQCSTGFPFLCDAMFAYMCDIPLQLSVEEIPNQTARTLAEQIQNATSIEEIRACSEQTDILAQVGYTTPIVHVTQKKRICESIHKYYCVIRIKQELDQLKEGLKSCGLLEALQIHKEMFRALFCTDLRSCLTAEKIKSLFMSIEFSSPKSVEREAEELVYLMFIDLLHDIEGGTINGVSLKNVLSFFTGAEDIPLTGYDTTPTLMFDHTSNPFITASTCAVQLTLPTVHSDDQAVFDEKVIYALRHHGGFGLV